MAPGSLVCTRVQPGADTGRLLGHAGDVPEGAPGLEAGSTQFTAVAIFTRSSAAGSLIRRAGDGAMRVDPRAVGTIMPTSSI